jgi:cyclophilin family peptidyl-prolyl cis-trans isomerase
MRTILLALVLFLCALAGAQGETQLRLTIEGKGVIVIKLHTKEAPNTTAHVIRLARSGFYNGLRFHRVEKTPRPFLVQIGDPASRSGDLNDPSMGQGGSGARIAYEDSGYGNTAGAVGLAAMADNRDTGDSQFYMLMTASRFLDGKYTVFGQIVSGMDVLRKIEKGDRVSTVQVVGG